MSKSTLQGLRCRHFSLWYVERAIRKLEASEGERCVLARGASVTDTSGRSTTFGPLRAAVHQTGQSTEVREYRSITRVLPNGTALLAERDKLASAHELELNNLRAKASKSVAEEQMQTKLLEAATSAAEAAKTAAEHKATEIASLTKRLELKEKEVQIFVEQRAGDPKEAEAKHRDETKRRKA